MPNILNPTIIIIWEHELRAAAKSLKPFAGGGKPTPEDAEKMLRACFAAIYSPELADGECPVTVMNCRETVMVSKTEVKA
jgi:hypothetical protein